MPQVQPDDCISQPHVVKQPQQQGVYPRGLVAVVLGLLPGLAFCLQQPSKDVVTNRLPSLTDNSGFVMKVRDAAGHITSYAPDGLLQQITSSGPSTNSITWAYTYNSLRRLTLERYTWGDPGNGWDFQWGIDANGNVSSLTDPWGTMSYAPNALGQPTQMSGYASGVTYHPNGAVAGYTLANGVNYSMAPNVRGLPGTMAHGNVAQDGYAYDANGNVTAIADQTPHENWGQVSILLA